MKLGPPLTQEAAEGVAVQALTFIAGDGERLGRFLAVTGIGPAEIRRPAASRASSPACSDYLASDDRLIAGFAAETGLDPGDVGARLCRARRRAWEREIP